MGFVNGIFVVAFSGMLSLFGMVHAYEDVAKAFIANEIVPDVIPKAPTQLLKVTYENDVAVYKGNELTPLQTLKQPKVEYYADYSAYYTLIMTDPDVPSRADPLLREFKHWLVINIPGNYIDQGEVLDVYIEPTPPPLTGLHRYVFLLYKQPGKLEFTEPPLGNNGLLGRPKFKAAEFAKQNNLGDPIAGNFFQAQFGV